MTPIRLALTLLFAAPAALAQDLPAPDADPLLTVSGEIGCTNDGDSAVFDRAMLESMNPVTIETETIWTDGVQSFTGVPLGEILSAACAEGSAIQATAINDYAVEIPRADWEREGPVVAYLNNGEPMSVRDKGPLWIVYPYDSEPEFQSEVTYSRSIWQLDRIVVTE
ncbi:oxidoreductase [Roseivivax sediminis]|uniref:Oxidoreductase molybdopterin-binding domain-containing protein n=1 Tax=Roseivivax sediminis TaxID=936889 RepID=A0A1I1X563_9RHOB|nr:oxidoreductase [Roseivivax sediminis]SFE00813.1 hypothetical protein SAMN04515678_105181 [Roseivivax sediminis]